jgi:glycosyltransferase involved in cell wall biosynthesis
VDVVHAHLPWPDRLGPALLAARGRPMVVTFHLLPDEGGWPRDRLLRLPGKQVLACAGRLRGEVRWVGLSHEDTARLDGLLGARTTRVRNAPPLPEHSRDPLAWPEGTVRLLSIGSLESRKGFDRMLEGLSSPGLRDLPWTWIVLGEGPDHAVLERRAAALGLAGRVRFPGARPAVDGYAGADLVLAPSRREGMPLVVLEALEAGVPVVASPIASHRELLGAIEGSVLPEEEARWPDGLRELLESAPRRRALVAAQRAVLGPDPRDTMWRAYESLYRSVAR